MPAGYSKRPLAAKLGIKPGFRICIVNAPNDYDQTLGQLPENVEIVNEPSGGLNLIQFFAKSKKELAEQFPVLKQALVENGMLWISWPKGTSGVETDLNGNVVRDIGLKNNLVDVKVCAVDEVWSGLKFVYRVKDRK